MTSLEDLIAPLLGWDASGRTWLSDLLAASPGAARLGELAGAPGWLVTPLAVPTADGRLGAFAYSVPAPRTLLTWFVEHPDRLAWPEDHGLSREGELLRRALVDDTPAGARPRAQERARELVATGALAAAWWRFEEPFAVPCALITDRLVVTVGSGDPLEPVNPWFAARTRLVRVLEAAAQLAERRRAATLWLGAGAPLDVAGLAEAVAEGAPHLGVEERAALVDGYLGALEPEAARAAVADELERARTSGRRGVR